jgi:hypothetical protein
LIDSSIEIRVGPKEKSKQRRTVGKSGIDYPVGPMIDETWIKLGSTTAIEFLSFLTLRAVSPAKGSARIEQQRGDNAGKPACRMFVLAQGHI